MFFTLTCEAINIMCCLSDSPFYKCTVIHGDRCLVFIVDANRCSPAICVIGDAGRVYFIVKLSQLNLDAIVVKSSPPILLVWAALISFVISLLVVRDITVVLCLVPFIDV